MFSGAQQNAPLWSPDVYALGVRPVWLVCPLLLGWGGLTTGGVLVGRAGSWPGWLWDQATCNGHGVTAGQGRLPTWLAVWPRGSWGWCWPPGGQSWVSSTNRLEGRFENGVCQHWCYHGRVSAPRWLLPTSMSPGGVPGSSCLSRRLLKISKCLTQALLKLPPLHWVSERVRLCMHPLRVDYLFDVVLQFSWT